MRRLLFTAITVFIIFILAFLSLSYISPLNNSSMSPETENIFQNPQSTLYFNSDSFYSSCNGETYSADVLIRTGENAASEIQIELSFDPKIIYNVNLTPSNSFFTGEKESSPLLYEIRESLGRASLALERKNDARLNGINLAVFTFQINSQENQATQIKFLDKSAVFSKGSDISLLKKTKPLTIYCSKTNLPRNPPISTPGN